MKKVIPFILFVMVFGSCKKDTSQPEWVSSPHLCKTADNDVTDTLYSVYIPNSFSPNGDGINDRFLIKGKCTFNSLQVFSKYNNLIFKATTMDTGWDGKVSNSNEMAPSGAYTFLLSISDKNEKEYKFQGNFIVYE
jgi:gliding motility-associated-like protein